MTHASLKGPRPEHHVVNYTNTTTTTFEKHTPKTILDIGMLERSAARGVDKAPHQRPRGTVNKQTTSDTLLHHHMCML